jgi:hypothetical protein
MYLLLPLLPLLGVVAMGRDAWHAFVPCPYSFVCVPFLTTYAVAAHARLMHGSNTSLRFAPSSPPSLPLSQPQTLRGAAAARFPHQPSSIGATSTTRSTRHGLYARLNLKANTLLQSTIARRMCVATVEL